MWLMPKQHEPDPPPNSSYRNTRFGWFPTPEPIISWWPSSLQIHWGFLYNPTSSVSTWDPRLLPSAPWASPLTTRPVSLRAASTKHQAWPTHPETALVGGWLNPSEKYESQLGWLFSNIWKNKTCSKPPTRAGTKLGWWVGPLGRYESVYHQFPVVSHQFPVVNQFAWHRFEGVPVRMKWGNFDPNVADYSPQPTTLPWKVHDISMRRRTHSLPWWSTMLLWQNEDSRLWREAAIQFLVDQAIGKTYRSVQKGFIIQVHSQSNGLPMDHSVLTFPNNIFPICFNYWRILIVTLLIAMNHYQPLLTTIKHYQSLLITINHYYPL